MLTNQEVAQTIADQFNEDVFDFEVPYDLLTFTTTREKIIDVASYLKNHEQYQITFLTDLTGVHYPDNAGKEFAVVYHLHSLIHNFRVRIKVFLPKEDLHIPSFTELFACANWMERETYDFYGILFDGHPKLIRILNVEEMDYFPMRKEYPLEDATRNDKIDALFGR